MGVDHFQHCLAIPWERAAMKCRQYQAPVTSVLLSVLDEKGSTEQHTECFRPAIAPGEMVHVSCQHLARQFRRHDDHRWSAQNMTLEDVAIPATSLLQKFGIQRVQ